jgi:hypothetical protein
VQQIQSHAARFLFPFLDRLLPSAKEESTVSEKTFPTTTSIIEKRSKRRTATREEAALETMGGAR